MYLKPIMGSEDIHGAIGTSINDFWNVDLWWSNNMEAMQKDQELGAEGVMAQI